jgi:hypothetical protein
MGLQVEGKEILREGWTPDAVTKTESSPAKPHAMADLRVGRPASISATLSVPGSIVTSCTLEPRPHGVCLVKARFLSATELRCTFECQAKG